MKNGKKNAEDFGKVSDFHGYGTGGHDDRGHISEEALKRLHEQGWDDREVVTEETAPEMVTPVKEAELCSHF